MTADRPWPDTGEIDLVEWSSNYFDEVSGNRIISALHFRARPTNLRHTEAQILSGRATSAPRLMSGTPTRCGGPG